LFRAIMHQQIERSAPSTLLQSTAGPLSLEAGLKSYASQMVGLNLEGDLLGVNRLIYSESHRFPELGAAAAERTALGIKRISQFIQACARANGRSCRDPEAAAEVFILALRGWYVNVLLTNRDVSVTQRERWIERAVHTLLSAHENW